MKHITTILILLAINLGIYLIGAFIFWDVLFFNEIEANPSMIRFFIFVFECISLYAIIDLRGD